MPSQLETIANETNSKNSLDTKQGLLTRNISRIGKYLRNEVIVLAILVLFSGCSTLEDTGSTPLEVGYEYWNFSSIGYEHETHPDDKSFLTGSPGSTEIKHGHFLKISNRIYLNESSPRFYGELALLAGYGEDRHKNDNDPRPIGNHSAVYSKIFPVAPQIGLGAEYQIVEGFDVGAEVTATVFFVENGWDRWGEDESADKDTKFLYNVGPVIKYRFNDDWSLKLKVAKSIGDDSWSLSVGIAFDL